MNYQRPVIVMARSFPPSIEAGGSVVLRNLFGRIDPRDFVVVAGNLPPQDPVTRLNVPTAVVDIFPARYIYSRFGFLFVPIVCMVAVLFALRYRPRHILALYPFDFFAIAAYWVACLLCLPYSIYLHDVWEEAQKSSIQKKIARLFEPRLVRQAKHVFVISDALREHFKKKYGVECIVVRHPIPFHIFLPKVRYDGASKNLYHIVYTGNVSQLNCDTVRNLIDSGRHIRDIPIQIDFCTAQTSAELARWLGITKKDRVTIQTVSSAEIPYIQQNADLLFVGISFELNAMTANTVFPTKFTEYLCAGKPIIVHAPADSFLARFVREHECAYLVEKPDMERLCQAIVDLLSKPQLATHYARKAVETAQYFEDRRQVHILADALGMRLIEDGMAESARA
jgi:glycosyltransferase involved in cell wall biosynthesis